MNDVYNRYWEIPVARFVDSPSPYLRSYIDNS